MPSDVQNCDSSVNEQEKHMRMEGAAAVDAEREKEEPDHERNEGGEHETRSAGERHYLEPVRCEQEESSVVDEQDQEVESSVIGEKDEPPVSTGERAFLESMGMCPAPPPHPVKHTTVDDDNPSLNCVDAGESSNGAPSDSRAENRQETHVPSAGEQAFIDAMASPTEQKGKGDASGLGSHNLDSKTTKRTRKQKRKKSQLANQNDPGARKERKKSRKSKGGGEDIKLTRKGESKVEENATHAKDVGCLLSEKRCLERELARMREDARQISRALDLVCAAQGAQLSTHGNSGGMESTVARQIFPRKEKCAFGDDQFSPSRIPDDLAPEETRATHKSLDPPVLDGIEPVSDYSGATNAQPTASGTHHTKDIQVQHESKVSNPLLPDHKSTATGKELATTPDTKNGNMDGKVAEALPTRSEGATSDSRKLRSCLRQSSFYKSWRLRHAIERSKDKLFFIKVPLSSKAARRFTWRLVQVPPGEGDSFEAMIGIYRVREYMPHHVDRKTLIQRKCRFWPKMHFSLPNGSLTKPFTMRPKRVLSGKMQKQHFASTLTTNLLQNAVVGPFDFETSAKVPNDCWTKLERSAARLRIAISDINKIIDPKVSQRRRKAPVTADLTPSPIPKGAQPEDDGAKRSEKDDSDKPQTSTVDFERASSALELFSRSRELREALEKSSDKLFFVKRGHSPGQFAWSLVKVVGDDQAGGLGSYRVLEYSSHSKDRKKKAQRHCRFWPRALQRCVSEADTFMIVSLSPKLANGKFGKKMAAHISTANLLDDGIFGPFDFMERNLIKQEDWDCLKQTATRMGIATDEIDKVVGSNQCKVATGSDGIQATAETRTDEMSIDVDDTEKS